MAVQGTAAGHIPWTRRLAEARLFGRPTALLLGSALILVAAGLGLSDNLGGTGPFGLSDEAASLVLDLGVAPAILSGIFAFANAAAAVVIFGLYVLIAACALEGRPWARVAGAAAALPAAAGAAVAHSGGQLFTVLLASAGIALFFTRQVSAWLAERREVSREDARAVQEFLDRAADRYEPDEEDTPSTGAGITDAPGRATGATPEGQRDAALPGSNRMPGSNRTADGAGASGRSEKPSVPEPAASRNASGLLSKLRGIRRRSRARTGASGRAPEADSSTAGAGTNAAGTVGTAVLAAATPDTPGAPEAGEAGRAAPRRTVKGALSGRGRRRPKGTAS